MLGIGLGLSQAALAADPPPIDLDGHWVLNERLSQGPPEPMQSGPGGDHRGGPGGPPGGGGPGGAPPGGMDREQMRRRMQERERALRVLQIEQQGTRIRIRLADGSERVLVADNKRHRRESPVGDVETRARWTRGGTLIVTAITERNEKISEVYRHAPGEDRLHVTVTTDGGGNRPRLRFERVYDRAADERTTPGD